MELSFAQIKSVSFGYDHMDREENGLFFHRFSAEAARLWGEIRGDFGIAAKGGAGIRFDFWTDSEYFAMLPSAPLQFDILVDGSICRSTTPMTYDGQWGWIRCALPEGEHRVTVLFPCYENCHINKVELSDGASVRPYTYERKILFYGDSITHGTGAFSTYATYACRLSSMLNADWHNQAIGGTFFAPKSYQADLDFEPDIIIIAYGTNDWGFFSGPDRMELRSRQYLDKVIARYGDKKIFGVTPLWRANNQDIRTVGTFDTARAIARQAHLNHDIPVLEGYELLPNQGEFFTDGLHPNNMGHACLADALYWRIKEAL